MIYSFSKAISITAGLLLVMPDLVPAQTKVNSLQITGNTAVSSVSIDDKQYAVEAGMPLVSYAVNKNSFTSGKPSPAVELSYTVSATPVAGELMYVLHFKNISKDTIQLHNVYPFDNTRAAALITGRGNHGLSRTHLFLPGKEPVNVIVPDNSWELGYASVKLDKEVSVAALTRRRRAAIKGGVRTRFETILYPDGTVDYNFFILPYKGEWQAGMTRIFQEKMLYDTTRFDNTLFEREDLKWVRHSYIFHLMDAWDKNYYDITDGKYHLKEFLEHGKKLYGGDDVVGVWPTWPTLGLDQRNQFDLFDDLPGGLAAMKKQAEICRSLGARFFICYNPWDESTNFQNHFKGLSWLIKETTSDGVVLDCKAEAGNELQNAADRVRKGVIMYSEGMSVPKNMTGIASGRVHNALEYPPMLNLNKLIKPEFTIYRVAEIKFGKIQREYATSFFNGYGTEVNIMGAGKPDWVDEQYKYLGRTTRILRENTHNFVNRGFTPLLPVTADNIWVNKWAYSDKVIYTIYSIIPQGYKGTLFEVEPAAGKHLVDIWHHRLLQPVKQDGKWMVAAETQSFDASDLGTNNEGNVDCIAQLPEILSASINGDELKITSTQSRGEIRVWTGNPDYAKEPLILPARNQTLSMQKYFGRFEGNFIIQYMLDGILQDETIVTLETGTPRRVSSVQKTKPADSAPVDMVKVPGGSYKFKTTFGDEFIKYPRQDEGKIVTLPSFWMDIYPVTNVQFNQFLKAARYKPTDKANFLKHWKDGKIPTGQENFPVVYVSYEDAKAYAKWAEKRLPTEIEWQYAAQAGDTTREWPWNQEIPLKRRNEYVTNTLTVVHLDGMDSTLCNSGNGKLFSVGKYPKGKNPYGIQDLVGCVWQLTNDEYMQSSHRYIILKGGSYFKPSGSWWYVQGGPRELHFRQYLLRVSQGFERNATVGFRCVKDL